MKDYFKTYISYLEDISNIGSWIVDEYNRKRWKSDIGVIIELEGKKRQAILDIPQLLKQKQDKRIKLVAMAF